MEFETEATDEKVYVHCVKTGATVARLCNMSMEIIKDPCSEGYDYVKKCNSSLGKPPNLGDWSHFKMKVKEILEYTIPINVPKFIKEMI